MPTLLSFLSGRQITNASGVPQSGAKLKHYRANTTTALPVWTDAGASVAHGPPAGEVTCDAGGFVPLIYVDDTFDWKVVVTTAADVTLQTYDNLPKAETEASSLGFAPPLLAWNQVTNLASPVALTVDDVGKAYEADTTGGSIEFDLPSAASVGNGKGFWFKKTASANTLTVDPNGTETIDDVSASFSTTRQYHAFFIASNGAEWYIAADYLGGIVASQLPAPSDTERGGSEIATQAEMETATDVVRTVAPGRQHFHPAHAKVGGAIDGTGTVTLLADFGIASVTDGGSGLYTVNFDTAFADTNFWVASLPQGLSGPADYPWAAEISRSTGAVTVGAMMGTDGTATDTDRMSVAAWGDYA